MLLGGISDFQIAWVFFGVLVLLRLYQVFLGSIARSMKQCVRHRKLHPHGFQWEPVHPGHAQTRHRYPVKATRVSSWS